MFFKRNILLVVIVCLIGLSFAQQCRNNRGWRVEWWVMLVFPNSVSTGFAYMDSRFTTANLTVFAQEPDTIGTPLTRTINQIANLSMQSLLWNDQTPSGQESSVRAHSKSIVAFDTKTDLGFMIVHSIPQYPNFNGSLINVTIDVSQQKYAQHIFCISGDKNFAVKMINKIQPIKPLTYFNNYDCGMILNQVLSIQSYPADYINLFSYLDFQKNGTQFKAIFKNGNINGSIFEDGVNNMLNSSLVSQTWGRPLSAPWCGNGYKTGNIRQVAIQNLTWTTSQDHSKWLVAVENNFSCFGDMNRMDSQWTRGGAFYCLQSQLLSQALKSIIKTTQTCPPPILPA